MRKFGLALLAFGATATLFAASAYDPAIFSSLTWRSIGPPRGGRSIAAAGSASRPLEYYFGATGGGLWKTTDGGTHLAAGHRRPDPQLVGRRRRGFRIQSRRRLHRHGRDRTARQHHAGRRRLQVDRRRQDVEARRPRRHAGHLAHPRPSDQSRHRLRRRARPSLRPERGARRLPLEGRRRDVGEDPVSATTRPARSIWCIDPNNPQRALRRHLGGLPHALEPVERRPRQRPLQVHRRRRSLDRDHAQSRACPQGIIGKIGVAVSGADSNRVYAIVENENGGVFVSDDAGATWKKVSEDRNLRQRAFYYTRIYADPKAKDTVYVLNVELLQVHRRRQDVPPAPPAARRQPRPVDRPRPTRSA